MKNFIENNNKKVTNNKYISDNNQKDNALLKT